MICILGVGCVGKSTYCKKLLDDYKLDGKPRPILLQLGEFFRTVYGPDFFKTLDNPAAPEVTEHWVRSNVNFAIQTCYNLSHPCGFKIMADRDIILDAVPRTPAQFHWLMLSSTVSARNIPVEMRFLYVAEKVLEERQAERRTLNPKETGLLDARVEKDLALHKNVVSAVANAILGETYPRLTTVEVYL